MVCGCSLMELNSDIRQQGASHAYAASLHMPPGSTGGAGRAWEPRAPLYLAYPYPLVGKCRFVLSTARWLPVRGRAGRCA